MQGKVSLACESQGWAAWGAQQGQREKHWERGKYLLMTHLILIQLFLLLYCSGCGESDKQKNPSGAGMLQPKNSERRYLLPPCAAWSSSRAEHTDTAFKSPLQTQDASPASVGPPKWEVIPLHLLCHPFVTFLLLSLPGCTQEPILVHCVCQKCHRMGSSSTFSWGLGINLSSRGWWLPCSFITGLLVPFVWYYIYF